MGAPLIVPPLSRASRARETEPKHSIIMTIRTRKLFGAIALLLLALVWSLMGIAIAQMPLLANSGILQAVFYVVAGIGWVVPAMPIVSWMSRPDIK